MEYLTSFDELNNGQPSAVMIGKFDGIHRGHELLAKRIVAKKQEGMKAVLVTFAMENRLTPEGEEQKALITMEERRHIFSDFGIDVMLSLPFNKELIHTPPEVFIRKLKDAADMKYLCAGTDFRFGYRGEGDTEKLKDYAKELGFTVEILEKLKQGDREISSTYIREEIAKGNVDLVRELLGYPYFIWGEVIHGNGIGHTIGVPTINMQPPAHKQLPPNGVYFTTVEIDNRLFHGVTNVGTKPTIAGDRSINVETHILDFKSDVYEHTAKVSFFEYRRPERKFESLEALMEQIRRDRRAAFEYFNMPR